MPQVPLIGVGASAGGISAVRSLLSTFPATIDAAIAVVIHRPPVEEDDRLAHVIGGASPYPVTRVIRAQPILPGRLYLASAGFHLLVEGQRLELGTGPKENGSRPAIDVLFRSAARTLGAQAIGIVLSGVMDDGTAGLAAIHAAGGKTFAQDPSEAQFGDMPRNAIANVAVDGVCKAAQMWEYVEKALHNMPKDGQVSESTPNEWTPSPFACPDCHGVLSERMVDAVHHYRCRTGHAYGPVSLLVRQGEALEDALWASVRALLERAEMSEVIAERLRVRGSDRTANRLMHEAQLARERARVVRSAFEDLRFNQEIISGNEDASSPATVDTQSG